MNIIFFAHPDFLGHQSMPRFASMLETGMGQRGHSIKVWSPEPLFFKFPAPNFFKKWLGYIDQYIVFPRSVKKSLKLVDKNALFVFTDNALGPWVPLVSHRPHVIHCHDFLAQRSALGEIPENRTGFTGKLYQKMIRKGYAQGKNFISVSEKTKTDLHRFLDKQPSISAVIYNGMNRVFEPQDVPKTRNELSKKLKIDLSSGFILHVGGNQWYKNRIGILEIYSVLRKIYDVQLPLLLIGEKPDDNLKNLYEKSSFQSEIHFLSGCTDEVVHHAYASASLLLYPSYEEGFGWPIAEAMASGCPVVTTEMPPMTEVASSAGFYIPKRPIREINNWANNSAKVVVKVLSHSEKERKKVVQAGLENIRRFNKNKALNDIEAIYTTILEKENKV